MEESQIKIGDVARHRYLPGRHKFYIANVADTRVLARYVIQGGKIETLEMFVHEIELLVEQPEENMDDIGV
ncbi:hypothetical protein DHW03_18115 [Pedobacter yonginense]|uniref:Uncharacterized protein n=1 Tax=Pedobacter yonginense TaxID=651869 RepID=A0A317ELS3_9SPHI|nr:hypothetical protein [Pedobacter yonginense]PWS25968.1 hypothetical protein DHW03_18115 [Pedobacter yonginense]